MNLSTRKSRQVDATANIHPTAVIEDGVVIGAKCQIGAFAVIGRGTKMGPENIVHSYAHVGSAPQVRGPQHTAGTLEIGRNNQFFQGCSVSVGTDNAQSATRIGDHNLLMASVHVGHDAQIGHRNTIANHSSLAGHVELSDEVTIGGYVGVHQFVRMGCYAFVAARSMVSQDVPPFGFVAGDRATLIGINRKGIHRAAFSTLETKAIIRSFRHHFGRSAQTGEKDERWSILFESFLKNSSRGVLTRAKGKLSTQLS